MACFPLKRGIIANSGPGPVNQLKDTTMVLIIDGNSEEGAHVRSKLCYSISLRYLIRSSAVKNRIFSPHACATYSELPFNIRTMAEAD